MASLIIATSAIPKSFAAFAEALLLFGDTLPASRFAASAAHPNDAAAIKKSKL
jgi:hypothetical protein